jgi:probable HAF family extracellular repeat protein
MCKKRPLDSRSWGAVFRCFALVYFQTLFDLTTNTCRPNIVPLSRSLQACTFSWMFLLRCIWAEVETWAKERRPVSWDRGRMRNLGTLGGTFAAGTCPNDRGQVIGQSNLIGDTEEHAFLWERGNIKDLGTLGGTFLASQLA